MKSSASYNQDPDVLRCREEMARRAKRPKVQHDAVVAAARDFRAFKVGKTKQSVTVVERAPHKPTERQRVLFAIEMAELRWKERGGHVGR